jgi:hypothetical protein
MEGRAAVLGVQPPVHWLAETEARALLRCGGNATMTHAIREFFREVTHRDFWLVEFGSGAVLMAWATVNLTSPDHLSQKNFGPLLAWVSEQHLETFTLAVGAIQFASLLGDCKLFRAVSSGLAAYLTGAISFAMIYKGTWPPGAIAFYAGNASLNISAMIFNLLKRSGVT